MSSEVAASWSRVVCTRSAVPGAGEERSDFWTIQLSRIQSWMKPGRHPLVDLTAAYKAPTVFLALDRHWGLSHGGR